MRNQGRKAAIAPVVTVAHPFAWLPFSRGDLVR
jgi:hypothetical protein